MSTTVKTISATAVLVAGLLVAGCGAESDGAARGDAAANETVVIEDRVHDMAIAGTDDVAVYTPEDMRRYLSGGDPLGRRFELDRITFASGSAVLDTAAVAQIGDIAAVLENFPNAALTVTAFADPEGSGDANRKLAADRALAVEQALQSAGIPDTAVRTIVGGEIGTSITRDKRRVEFMVERR